MLLTTNNAMVVGLQLNRTEAGILKFLLKNVAKESSIRAIAEEVGQNYPIVYNNIIGLNKKGAVRIRKINPKQSLCSADLSKKENVGLFSTVEFNRRDDFLSKKPALSEIIGDVLKRIEGNSFTLMLFGSHSKGTARQDSDIDLLFLVASMEDEKRMLAASEGAGRLINTEIHPIVMTYDSFFAGIGKPGLPKEVLENHIIIYGAEAFYRGLIMHG